MGINRYDSVKVTYDKEKLAEGDLIISSANYNLVRVRSVTGSGANFTAEYLFNVKGADGNSFKVVGSVSSVSELPSADALLLGTAYYVGAAAPREVYAMVKNGNTVFWQNQGVLSGPKGDKGLDGTGFYISTQSFTTGVNRYDVSSVAYNKPELASGDLILSSSNGVLVRVRSISADGFVFVGEYVYSFK